MFSARFSKQMLCSLILGFIFHWPLSYAQPEQLQPDQAPAQTDQVQTDQTQVDQTQTDQTQSDAMPAVQQTEEIQPTQQTDQTIQTTPTTTTQETTTTTTTSVINNNTSDPLTLAASWLQEANLPKYVILGTLKNAKPRIKVIAKGDFTQDGYRFKLNESSDSSQELTGSSDATILITWDSDATTQKQIKIYGTATAQGTAESHSITYQNQKLDFSSRTYLLKPIGIQFAVTNYNATDVAGVVQYIDFVFENGKWKSMPQKTLAFDKK